MRGERRLVRYWELCDAERADQERMSVRLPTDDRRTVAGVLEVADVVIEGSRPRAMRPPVPYPKRVPACGTAGRRVSVLAYGWTAQTAHAVGFGDDEALVEGFAATMTGVPEHGGVRATELAVRRRGDRAPERGVRRPRALRRLL
jgi:hypothetical protein